MVFKKNQIKINIYLTNQTKNSSPTNFFSYRNFYKSLWILLFETVLFSVHKRQKLIQGTFQPKSEKVKWLEKGEKIYNSPPGHYRNVATHI